MLPDPDCKECEGTGEVRKMEAVYNEPGSPEADIGTEPCQCRWYEDDEDSED